MEHAPTLSAGHPASIAGPGASTRDPGARQQSTRHAAGKGTDSAGQNKENVPFKRVRFTDMEEDAGPLLFNARDSMYMRAELQREWDFGIPAQEEAHRYARWFAEEAKREAAEQAALEAEEGVESSGTKGAYAKADKAVHPNRLSTDLSGLDLDLKNLGDDVSGLDVFSRVEVALGKQKEEKAEKKRREKAEKEKSRHKSSGSISMALSPKRGESADSVLPAKEKKGSRFLRKVISDRIVVKDKDKGELDEKKSRDIADFIGGLAKQAQQAQNSNNVADSQNHHHQLRPTESNTRPISPPQPLPSLRDNKSNTYSSHNGSIDSAHRDNRKPAPVETSHGASDWSIGHGGTMTISPSQMSVNSDKRPSPPLPPDQPTRRPVPGSTQVSSSSIKMIPNQQYPSSSYPPEPEERKSRANRSESSPGARTYTAYSHDVSEERRPSAPHINYYPKPSNNDLQYQQNNASQRPPSSQQQQQQQRQQPDRANSHQSVEQYQSSRQQSQTMPPPAPPPQQQRQTQAPPPAAPPPHTTLQKSSSQPPQLPPLQHHQQAPPPPILRQSSSQPPQLPPPQNTTTSINRLPVPNTVGGHLSSPPSNTPSSNSSRQPSPSPNPHNQTPAPPPPSTQQPPPARLTSSEDIFSRIEQELANSAAADNGGHHGKGRKFLGKAFGHVKDGVAKAKAKSGK